MLIYEENLKVSQLLFKGKNKEFSKFLNSEELKKKFSRLHLEYEKKLN